MIFKKKNVGNIFEKVYVWTSNARGHLITVHFENETYQFWFDVKKEGKIIFTSTDDDMIYPSLEEVQRDIETWVELNIKPRKARHSTPQKYLLLLNSIKKVCRENPDLEVSKDLMKLLKEIREI